MTKYKTITVEYILQDPGISTTRGYAPYDDGLNRGVFIRTHDNSSFIVGKVY